MDVFDHKYSQQHSSKSVKDSGHHQWIAIHNSTIALPKKIDDETYKDFVTYIRLIGKFFRCEKCGGHFNEIILPILEQKSHKLRTREKIVKLFFNIHNAWNIGLGKKTFSFHEFCQFYNYDGSPDSPDSVDKYLPATINIYKVPCGTDCCKIESSLV